MLPEVVFEKLSILPKIVFQMVLMLPKLVFQMASMFPDCVIQLVSTVHSLYLPSRHQVYLVIFSTAIYSYIVRNECPVTWGWLCVYLFEIACRLTCRSLAYSSFGYTPTKDQVRIKYKVLIATHKVQSTHSYCLLNTS